MSANDIISLHRIKGYDLHNVGVDLIDATHHLPNSVSERSKGIPFIRGIEQYGAPFVVQTMSSKSPEEVAVMWTGIEYDMFAKRPYPLGVVTVTSAVELVLGERTRKQKPTSITATCIDVASFDESSSPEALIDMGRKVATLLHPNTPTVMVERTGYRSRTPRGQETYLHRARTVFPHELFRGVVSRKGIVAKIGSQKSTKSLSFDGVVKATKK